MTNREWLTSLTDRELGYVLFCGLSCDVKCMDEPGATVDSIKCANCGADWLSREHEAGDTPDDFRQVKEVWTQNGTKPKTEVKND